MMLLDRNENPYGPAPACSEVLRTADLRGLSYYSRSYTKGTKGPLAERLSSLLTIPEKQVLLGYGSEDMLKQAVQHFLPPHGVMLIPSYSWWYYRRLAEEARRSAVPYPVLPQDERFRYDPEAIISLYRQHRPHVILIASPNNPTGNVIAEKELAIVLSACPDAVVLLDEAYAGFDPPGSFRDIPKLLNLSQRLVVLRTFSKYYALAGLRIGFACVGEELPDFITLTSRYLGYNRLSEELALAALDAEEYYRKAAAEIVSSKLKMIGTFRSLEAYRAYESAANFLLVRHPEGEGDRIASTLLRKGIAVRFFDDETLSDFMRITIGTRNQVDAVLSAFREISAMRPARSVVSER
jgi:histidinol-phosphate aminotransferase